MKISKRSCLLLLTLFLISCQISPDYSQIRVSEVIDGDTIRLSNGRLLRYIGLDTPEIRIKDGSEFLYSPQPYSLEAKEFNQNLVSNKIVRIEFDRERQDRYGRLLGYCFVDDTFVNAKLIQEGYAVLYTYPPNIKYSEKFLKLSKRARSQQKGLWGSLEVIDHSQAGNYINQIRTVRGRVLDTYKSEKCVYLNFGSDYKKDFTIVIFNNVISIFKGEGIDPLKFYKGKLVEVTGRIRQYNGAEIIVNSPQDIEILPNP